MKVFNIFDEENKLNIGELLYYVKSKTFVVLLSDKLDEWTAPLLFTSFVKRGVFVIPRDVSALFVKERVIPSDRQNIQSILATHKMKEYDAEKLLELSKGRCSQDRLVIEEVSSLCDASLRLMQENIKHMCLLKNKKMLCIFNDESIRIINFEELADIEHMDLVLKNDELYNSASISPGGFSISFNNSIDVPADVIYKKSKDTGLCLEDLLRFINSNVIDTGDAIKMLGCSRQNLSYLISKSMLCPIKEDVNGKLFFRSDAEQNLW